MDFGKETRKLETCWLQMDFQKEEGNSRTILSIVAKEDLEFEQMDVKTAFLHGDLEETIYMKQPEGFVQGSENQLLRISRKLASSKKVLEVNLTWGGKRKLFLSQQKYLEKVKFGMSTCKSVSAPLAQHFKLSDIAYFVSVVHRFMANLGKTHWHALKWILRYLRGFVYSDYAGSIDTRNSLFGYIFTIFGGLVSWKASLQKGFVSELGYKQEPVTVFCDNQSAIYLVRNPMFHERSKHIDVKLHFIREVISSGAVKFDKIATEENPTDALTKSLPVAKFELCLNLILETWKVRPPLKRGDI
ncbi:hypothetical protein AAG906_039135 [Vitis piasezkii]